MRLRSNKFRGLGFLLPILLAVLGMVIASLGVMPSAEHWAPWVYYSVKDIFPKELFGIIATPPPAAYHFIRPAGALIVKELLSFGANSPLPYLLHGITFPLFGLGAYSITRLYCSRSVAFLAAISAMSIPPTLFSGWLISEFDSFGAGILLFALTAYERFLSDSRNILRGALACFLLILTSISKETTAVFAMIFLFVATLHSFYQNEDKRYTRLLLFSLYCILVIFVYYPIFSHPGGRRIPFSGEALPFLLLHNFIQTMYLISPMGSIALLLVALHRLVKNDRVRTGLSHAWLPISALLFMAPITVIFSHYECVMISPISYSAATAVCVFLSLLLLSVRPYTLETTYAKSIFYCICVTTLAPLVLPSSREEVSARVFIPFAPFLFSFIYKGIANSVSQALSWHGLRRVLLLLGCAIFILNFAYYPPASIFNMASEHRTRIRTEYEAKEKLASELKDESVVLVNNMEKFTGIEEFKHLWNEKLESTTFVLIPSIMMKGNNAKLITQLCGIKHVFKPKGEAVFIYFLSPKSALDESIGKWLAGDFNWVEGKTFRFLAVFPGWDFNVIENHLYSIYAKESTLENTINKTGEIYFEAKYPYIELPLWINDVPSRLGRGVPVLNKMQYKTSLSTLNLGKLECPDVIPQILYVTAKDLITSEGKSVTSKDPDD